MASNILLLKKENEREYLDLAILFIEILEEPRPFMRPRNYFGRTLAYLEKGKPIAGLVYEYDSESKILIVNHLAVSSEHQRKGIGRCLLDRVEGMANGKVSLRTKDTSKKFYEKCGYQEDFSNPEKIWMTKERLT